MNRTVLAIARVAACVALVVWLAGCKKGTLGDPVPGGAGRIMGAGARGASGIGGASGAGSGGSTAGRGGTSGGGMVSCPPPPPPVCGALCGNGKIDSCIGALSLECIPFALREECDGDNLGRASCAELGYPSGKLVCDKTCSFASGSGCSECVPMATSVASCGTTPPLRDKSVSNYAIAATDSDVGLAEVAYDATSATTLSLRRLSPSLDVAGHTTLLDTSRPGPLEGASVGGVAVAPTPSGWVIAGCVSGQVLLFTVDLAGKNSALPPVPVGDRFCEYAMVLAARPGGGSLLVWASGTSVSGALIAADGQSGGAPFDIIAAPIGNAWVFDGAWVGDAFNVVVTAYLSPDYYDRALRIARIDVNGAVTSRDVLMDEFEEGPRLVRGAADTRATYIARYDQSAGIDIKWRRFGSAGEPLADAVLVAATNDYVYSPAVAFGDDTLVLLASDQQVSSLSLTRVGSDGAILTRPYEILRAPPFFIVNPDMVRRGPDAIVSWLSYDGDTSRVGLARITP